MQELIQTLDDVMKIQRKAARSDRQQKCRNETEYGKELKAKLLEIRTVITVQQGCCLFGKRRLRKSELQRMLSVNSNQRISCS